VAFVCSDRSVYKAVELHLDCIGLAELWAFASADSGSIVHAAVDYASLSVGLDTFVSLVSCHSMTVSNPSKTIVINRERPCTTSTQYNNEQSDQTEPGQ
jgi:hypothetical protein